MTKSELRDLFKRKRQKVTEKDLEDDSVAIANNFLKLDIWDKDYFHVYLPITSKNEIDTEPLLHILSGKDKYIAIPKSDFKTNTFKNVLLTDNTPLKKNAYGIPEPLDGIELSAKTFDVIIIPLLAFDLEGHRVGYGKGFYDRFLSDCRDDAIKVGLSQFDAVELISDANALDIKLDYCITPRGIISFKE